MKLHTLRPGIGSVKPRKRVGRGNASGSGRTSGRGEKGQKARSGGKVRPGFEGGQMPLYRRVPKSGFISKKKLSGFNVYNIVNLSSLESFEDGATVDHDALFEKGLGLKFKNMAGIKVLGEGDLTKKLVVKADAFSKSAKAKIESLGGQAIILSEVE